MESKFFKMNMIHIQYQSTFHVLGRSSSEPTKSSTAHMKRVKKMLNHRHHTCDV